MWAIAVEGHLVEHCFKHELSREEKGKLKAHVSQLPSNESGTMVRGSCLGDDEVGGVRSLVGLQPKDLSEKVKVTLLAVVKRISHNGGERALLTVLEPYSHVGRLRTVPCSRSSVK